METGPSWYMVLLSWKPSFPPGATVITSVAGAVLTLHVAAALVMSWKGSTVGGWRTALPEVVSPATRTLKMSMRESEGAMSKPSAGMM